MSILTNKEFLVDFDRILRVYPYDPNGVPDGLLENQTVEIGMDLVEVLHIAMLMLTNQVDEPVRITTLRNMGIISCSTN